MYLYPMLPIDLRTTCSSCGTYIRFQTTKSTKAELREEFDEVELDCHNCRKVNTYTLEDFRATTNKSVAMGTTMLLLAGPPLVFFFLWNEFLNADRLYLHAKLIGIVLFPAGIAIAINKRQHEKVRKFNGRKYRRRMR